MKKRRSVLIIIFFISSFIVLFNIKKEKKNMRICFDTPWKNLHPGTQNTLVGGLLISQQFESLVKIDSNGNLSPSIAVSWEISSDYRVLKFTLDKNKKFSNGKKVIVDDVFNSWTNSFKMSHSGQNNSLKDVLYAIDGFEKGKEVKEIKGFIKINDYEMEIRFKNPFRMAIYHLRGARFSIYSIEGKNIFGSGKFKYDIESVNDELVLTNQTTGERVYVVYNKDAKDSLTRLMDTCDVYYSPSGLDSLSELDNNMDYVMSEDAVHIVFMLNTKEGVFSDVKMRKAFQYLIHQNQNISNKFISTKESGASDPQIFNKMSQGRLEDEEARKIISDGENYIDSFYDKIKKEKISVFVSKNGYLKEAFEVVKIADYLGEIIKDQKLVMSEVYAGKFKEDFTTYFLSVLSYDPDGIYHALGRHGAILNPYMANEKIFDLLEVGREITDRSKIDEHYKKVSRVFLEEVPFIHLGFSKNVLLFNKNKVKIGKDSFRNSLDFSSFEVL